MAHVLVCSLALRGSLNTELYGCVSVDHPQPLAMSLISVSALLSETSLKCICNCFSDPSKTLDFFPGWLCCWDSPHPPPLPKSLQHGGLTVPFSNLKVALECRTHLFLSRPLHPEARALLLQDFTCSERRILIMISYVKTTNSLSLLVPFPRSTQPWF
jgi:hypothetical protein